MNTDEIIGRAWSMERIREVCKFANKILALFKEDNKC